MKLLKQQTAAVYGGSQSDQSTERGADFFLKNFHEKKIDLLLDDWQFGQSTTQALMNRPWIVEPEAAEAAELNSAAANGTIGIRRSGRCLRTARTPRRVLPLVPAGHKKKHANLCKCTKLFRHLKKMRSKDGATCRLEFSLDCDRVKSQVVQLIKGYRLMSVSGKLGQNRSLYAQEKPERIRYIRSLHQRSKAERICVRYETRNRIRKSINLPSSRMSWGEPLAPINGSGRHIDLAGQEADGLKQDIEPIGRSLRFFCCYKAIFNQINRFFCFACLPLAVRIDPPDLDRSTGFLRQAIRAAWRLGLCCHFENFYRLRR